nr:immunoglobulin light chain junction region [Macaca mulatta]
DYYCQSADSNDYLLLF